MLYPEVILQIQIYFECSIHDTAAGDAKSKTLSKF